MAAARLTVCKYCGRKFVPEARNRDRQRVCGRPECRGAACRARKRQYYRRRIEQEEGFREAEQTRCCEAMRALRRKGKEPAAAPAAPFCAHDLLAGLVSQLGGTSDPREVAALMSAHADRGRRLAAVPLVRGSPG